MFRFTGKLKMMWGIDFSNLTLETIFTQLEEINDRKLVLIIDEVEGINPEYFGTFLHSIRNTYHARSDYCLKSVILVGVSNITGIIQDNASPFNIADKLNVPYFTDDETKELLTQHEVETGQIFAEKVKTKISRKPLV